jgi:hypothetical protein
MLEYQITRILLYKKTPWPESASELHRPSSRCLSAKLVPTCADGGCHVVSVTDPYSRILGFLDREYYCIHNYFNFGMFPMLGGSLPPQHGASSGCGWKNGLQLWKVAGNILSKQLWSNDKRWSFSFEVGHEANNPSP